MTKEQRSSACKWPDWSSAHQFFGPVKKPLEIYIFVDPACSSCWKNEMLIKRLQIEYGHYFSIKHVLCGDSSFSEQNDVQDVHAIRAGSNVNNWLKDPKLSDYVTSIAVKAAELQGKKAGNRFFKKIQESFFLDKRNIAQLDTLLDCAEQAELDYDEFLKDIKSESAVKALQCDLKIKSEMEVNEVPTFVFFNQKIDEEGLKVPGYYPYEIYVEILEDILGFEPQANPLPSLTEYMEEHQIVNSQELSFLYDLDANEIEREMKKLVLKRTVDKIDTPQGIYWKLKKE